ncbi:YggS family pyridoxal phosphate-dependent enzyme [Lysobacter aestuarii]|uniref:Pyridoxal phosphate homeostasis protein n=1 Tax=Marilutibacter aestuarii TaxID=1706195 RepID=A0A508AID4_9GAMM|nr:YggS family pyridoxal phosphate-dependent enzyme [Lysobacter aestuarii]
MPGRRRPDNSGFDRIPAVPAPLPSDALRETLHSMRNAAAAAHRPVPRLLAVAKTQPAATVAALVEAWRQLAPGTRPALGENYVQEASSKHAELAATGLDDLEWHLIGHLQSNKAREAAALFDWVQTVDRAKLVEALARHRPAGLPPLNVLVQVNIDDEASKHGCRPADVDALADAVAAHERLRLRGLMAIPAPDPDPERRREAFRRMNACFEALRARHPGVDTLSMGMSGDYREAIAEGATLVRIGSALFGARAPKA